MSVRFILGPSGTGKTKFIIEEITAQLRSKPLLPLILLVPEQATYQAERAIIADGRVKGYSNLYILSFQRLAFMLGGRASADFEISKQSEMMILRLILAENRDKLRFFGKNDISRGFTENILDVIYELISCEKQIEEVEAFIEKLRQESQLVMALKFQDILYIYRKYLEFIEQRQFFNPESCLSVIQDKIRDTGFIQGAQLWVDGFSDFTCQEWSVLFELIKCCSKSSISFCLKQEYLQKPIEETAVSVFAPTIRTYRKIADVVRDELKIKIDKPILLDRYYRFSSGGALEHIAKNIFTENTTKINSDGNIKITAAADRRSEINFVADQICSLVRYENYRYRDIAVIISEPANYSSLVKSCFDDYQIPFFVDSPVPIAQHRFVEFVSSALKIATGDFNTAEILCYLKSGLTSVSDEEIDELENYCLAFDVRDEWWLAKLRWSQGAGVFELNRINLTKDKILKQLLSLRDKLNADDLTVENFAGIVVEFCNSENVFDKMTDANADINAQVISSFDEILEQMVMVYQGRKLNCEMLIEIFIESMSQISLGVIPPMLDQVLVGTVGRSRHPEVKAVFLVGAEQGSFPAAIPKTGLINERERIVAGEAGFILADDNRTKLLERQYLSYIAFTRASEKLYITYPLTNEKAQLVEKSSFVSSLARLFCDDIENKYYSAGNDVFSQSQFYDWLAVNGRTKSVVNLIKETNGFESYYDFIRSAVSYDNSVCMADFEGDKFFGNKIKSSFSEIESFASCRFQHFAKYILKLRKRRVWKIFAIDIGSYYHNIIDMVTKKVIQAGTDFGSIPWQRLEGFVKSSVTEYLSGENPIANFARRSGYSNFVITNSYDVLVSFFRSLCQQSSAGEFKVFKSETDIAFGDDRQGFAVELKNGRELLIRGKIDRIDIACLGDKKIAMIVDYKLREKTIFWGKIYYGLDMQLMIYLLAGSYSKEFDVAGAFFMPIKVAADSAGKKASFAYKLKGIFDAQYYYLFDKTVEKGRSSYFNFAMKDEQPFGYEKQNGALRKDDFERLLKYTRKKIIDIGNEMTEGKIDIKPYRLGNKSPCSRCDYKSLCRFDRNINKYNNLKERDKMTLLKDITQQ